MVWQKALLLVTILDVLGLVTSQQGLQRARPLRWLVQIRDQFGMMQTGSYHLHLSAGNIVPLQRIQSIVGLYPIQRPQMAHPCIQVPRLR